MFPAMTSMMAWRMANRFFRGITKSRSLPEAAAFHQRIPVQFARGSGQGACKPAEEYGYQPGARKHGLESV
jgi:hypothetical protein